MITIIGLFVLGIVISILCIRSFEYDADI